MHVMCTESVTAIKYAGLHFDSLLREDGGSYGRIRESVDVRSSILPGSKREFSYKSQGGGAENTPPTHSHSGTLEIHTFEKINNVTAAGCDPLKLALVARTAGCRLLRLPTGSRFCQQGVAGGDPISHAPPELW